MFSVPLSTLRYYDKHNIICPAHVSDGGHRFYTYKQLLAIGALQFMKEVGFSARDAARILNDAGSRAALLDVLCRQRDELREKIVQLDNACRKIDFIERKYRSGTLDEDQVVIKQLPERVFHTIPLDYSLGSQTTFLFKFVESSPLYHMQGFPGELEMEEIGALSHFSDYERLGSPLYTHRYIRFARESEAVDNDAGILRVPSGRFVCMAFRIDLANRQKAYSAAAEYMRAQDLRAAGLMIESVPGLGMPPISEDEELAELQILLAD